MKKLSATEKVDRAKSQIMRCLEEIKNNGWKAQTQEFVTGQLAHTWALLDSEKTDEMGIVFVAVAILDELNPREKKVYISSPTNGTQLEMEFKK